MTTPRSVQLVLRTRQAGMKFLVLGGTRFLGRHLVDLALARGDDVTVFTRGKQPNHWQRPRHRARRQSRPGRFARPARARGRHVGCGRRHQRLRAARRAAIGGAPVAARRPLSLRVVDLRVHRCEPGGTDREGPRRHARGSGHRRDRQVLRSAQGGVRARGERDVTAIARSTCVPGSSSVRTIPPTASATGSRDSCNRHCSATARPRRSCLTRPRGRSS